MGTLNRRFQLVPFIMQSIMLVAWVSGFVRVIDWWSMKSNDAYDGVSSHFVRTMQNYFLPWRMQLINLVLEMSILIFENELASINYRYRMFNTYVAICYWLKPGLACLYNNKTMIPYAICHVVLLSWQI